MYFKSKQALSFVFQKQIGLNSNKLMLWFTIYEGIGKGCRQIGSWDSYLNPDRVIYICQNAFFLVCSRLTYQWNCNSLPFIHLICVLAYHRLQILCLLPQLWESSPKMLSGFLLILKIELCFSTNPCNVEFSENAIYEF